MNRRGFFGVLAAAPWLVGEVYGDPQNKLPRIGFLGRTVPDLSPGEELRQGLRELGYVEGKSIIIEWRRYAIGDDERPLAADLARSKLDVIVVFSTPAARSALEASPTMPVVFLSGAPVESGLAASLARPGGNATGVSGVLTELTAKRLELLHHVAPRARRILYLSNSSNPVAAPQLEATRKAARTFGVRILTLDARNEGELDAALRALSGSGADGILVTGDTLFRVNRPRIARAVRKARLPATFPYREYHEDGALMSYGPSLGDAARKMAVYVDRILKGAKPADLPIEQLSKYELVIDLRVARELGVKVPQDLLLRADEVIQ